MKRFITVLTTFCIASSVNFTVHAAEMLDKDYISSEIWSEMWLGKGDDGTEYPEGSYKHHLLAEWLDENYGSDDYDWSEIGELKYEYKDYYNRLIEDWDFNDDRNGNWTIDAEDNSYHFEVIGGKWSMIDQNGDTVDTFPIYSTLDEDEETPDRIPAGKNDNNGNGGAVGIIIDGTEKPSESLESENGKVSASSTSKATTSDFGRSENNALPLVFGGIAIVGIGTGGVILYKKRKK